MRKTGNEKRGTFFSKAKTKKNSCLPVSSPEKKRVGW